MKTTIGPIGTLVILLWPVGAWAQVSVRILDAPPTSYSYEPAYVTIEVRNVGTQPLILPADTCPREGVFLEVGPRGKTLYRQQDLLHCHSSRLVWLPPNGRWLFLEAASLGPEGMFEVQAVLRSPGECHGRLVGGPERPEIEPIRLDGDEKYECWHGEERSEPLYLQVSAPDSEIDRAAAELLGINVKAPWSTKFAILKLKELKERFPTSPITNAVAAVGGALGLLPTLDQQPHNPLNRFVAGAMEAQVTKLMRRCADPKTFRDYQPEKWWGRYEKFLAKHDPPQSMKDYVQQLKREYASEKCPEKQDKEAPEQGTGALAGNTEHPAAGATRQQSQQVATHPNASFGSGISPNIAFKRRLLVSPAPVERVFWLSLPYRYAPTDLGTLGVVDAEDLCRDLGAGITAILRWNEPTSTFVEHACGNPSPFALVKGTGYGVRIAATYSIGSTFAGGHDNGFTFSISPTGSSQLSWISLPYHLRKVSAGPGPFTAEDLCRQIGASEVRAVVRHDTETGIFHTYVCGSTFQTPFEITRGTAYGVINRSGQTISWQPEHY